MRRSVVAASPSPPPRRFVVEFGTRKALAVETIEERIGSMEGEEIARTLARAADRQRVELDNVAARVDVLELGRDLSDTDLMWVALDERLSRLESQQERVLLCVEQALQRLG
jgi:hypothetical protein